MIDESLDLELSQLIDGELSPEREAELRERLRGDEQLRERFAELEAVDRSLQGLEAPELPSDLRARLQQRIDDDASQPSADATSFSFRSGARVAAALAAAVVAAWLLFPAERFPTTPLDVAEVEAQDIQEVDPAQQTVVEEASDSELEIAFELETLQDLELIHELELLEALLAMEDEESEARQQEERG